MGLNVLNSCEGSAWKCLYSPLNCFPQSFGQKYLGAN